MSKLLTIAIPTYNREKYIDILLNSIFTQIKGIEEYIEITVSDNASSDGTENIINKFIEKGMEINYIKNEINIGADRNIFQCFSKAKTKYVHICGDDDVFVEGSLREIISILKNGEYGVVYLSSYGFKNDYKKEAPLKTTNTAVKCSKEYLIDKVSYYFTFISGNIINKEMVGENIDIEKHINTNLIQLVWTFAALFNSKENVYISKPMIAAKSDNTGGYRLFEVFGKNMNIIFRYFIEMGIDQKYFRKINNKILTEFFPFWVLKLRQEESSKFEDEDYIKILKEIYGRYLMFWIVLVPLIKLPKILMRIYNRLIRIIKIILRRTKKIFKFQKSEERINLNGENI